MIDNQKLAKQIKQGDIRAYELLFKAYYQALCNFAYTFTEDLSVSEDIVQEIFVKLWEKRSELNIKDSIKSYLFQSTKNACFNHLKHQKVHRKFEVYSKKNDPFSQDTSEEVNAKQLAALVDTAIEALPEKRKKVFHLSRQEGLKYKEIADKLGVSIKTVETQMGLALKFLRRELKDYLPLLAVSYFLYSFAELYHPIQGNGLISCLKLCIA
ncbi:MAG: RNA polymerase sigma-70 factor [Vicingaceae bacterium]